MQEVTEDKVVLSLKDPKNKDAKPEIVEIPAGFVLWSTGIGIYLTLSPIPSASLSKLIADCSKTAMNPFTKRLVDILPNQYHSKAVEVDSYLRVAGAPLGTVYAIGDAATIRLLLLDIEALQ